MPTIVEEDEPPESELTVGESRNRRDLQDGTEEVNNIFLIF